MNIITSTLGALLLAWGLPAAAGMQVFACEPEWAALAGEIGGDRVDVYSATTAYQDVHHIQARPSLIARVRRADIVICTGAQLEIGWLPILLQRAANRKVQPGQPGYFMAADQVGRLGVPVVLDRALGDLHVSGNPHVHLDPHRVATVAKSLANRLAQLDTSNAAFYQRTGSAFLQRWHASILKWEDRAAPLGGSRVVAHHKDWVYLLDWLDMQEVATLEPKPGIPPNAAHLARLKQQMVEQPSQFIVRTPFQNERPSQWLSERSGIPAVVLPYTVGGSDAATDLFGLFDDTITRLLTAMNRDT